MSTRVPTRNRRGSVPGSNGCADGRANPIGSWWSPPTTSNSCADCCPSSRTASAGSPTAWTPTSSRRGRRPTPIECNSGSASWSTTPRGWRPGGPEGSIRYQERDLEAFTDRAGQPVPVVLFAGRFMRFKRLQLLIEAHHAMRSTTTCRPVLVVAGGFPGEWEGEHPYDTVQRLGADGVFFVGWREHDDLSEILTCSDVFAAPSVEEPFGLVYLEAMASGVPPIATRTGGPLSFINLDPAQPTGWLVAARRSSRRPRRALGSKRSRIASRASHAVSAPAQFVREHYSWASSATRSSGSTKRCIDESSGRLRSDP